MWADYSLNFHGYFFQHYLIISLETYKEGQACCIKETLKYKNTYTNNQSVQNISWLDIIYNNEYEIWNSLEKAS